MSGAHGEGQAGRQRSASRAGAPGTVTAAATPARSPAQKTASKGPPGPGDARPPSTASEPGAPALSLASEVEPEPGGASRSTAGIDLGVELEPEPRASRSSLVIGIDGGYSGWSESEIAQRAELGAAVTRHEWEPTERVDEQDDVVQTAAEEIHTRIHALLGANQLGDPIHYREWVVAFVRRYGVGGSFWSEHPQLDASRYAITSIELGNEPYFGEMSAADYADAVRPTLERVQDLGLAVKVVLPAYVYGDNTSWIDTLYQRIPDLNSLFYAIAFHPYWYGHDPATPADGGPFARIGTLRQQMNELGGESKPIYLTEYGESTAACGGECVSEAVQAEHLKEMIEAVISHTAWKVEMLSLFQLLDRGTGSADRELQFGLLREDGTAKPAYAIVRGLLQRYR
jgi:hypothetical protein